MSATYDVLFLCTANSARSILAEAILNKEGAGRFRAYWFTSSTSFANPAITVARSLTNTFAGIVPRDVPYFIVAQLAGAAAGAVVAHLLFGEKDTRSAT